MHGHWRMTKANLLWAACLLQMLFSPLFLAAERRHTGVPSGVRCLNSYGDQLRRVDCTWHRNETLGEGPFYLNFSDPYQTERDHLLCWLSPSEEAQDEFSCSAEGSGQFVENDEYTVHLHDASSGGKVVSTAWEETYEPMKNIKCDPPYDFWSNMTGSKCLMAWKMPKAYVVIWEAMQWQLQVRATHVPWEQAKNKTPRETWIEIDGSEFTPGSSYVARVRCKTPEDYKDYDSQWSEWSTTTGWSVPPGPSQQEESVVLLAASVSVPLCFGALLFLLLLSGFRSRIKGCCLASIPSPATFFVPLYASHNGNFQAWIGIKEQDAWLRDGSSSADPGKNAGPGPVTPWALEATSQLSSFRRLSRVELLVEESVCPLPGAPDQRDKASSYVTIQEEAKAPMLPGRAPLHLEDLNAAGEGFPYLPYKNSLFVEQEPQETELLSCDKASCALGTCSTRSVVPV